MEEIGRTERAGEVIDNALACCKKFRHEFVTPEHLLFQLTDDFSFGEALCEYVNPDMFDLDIEEYLSELETVPGDEYYEPQPSEQMVKLLETAIQQVYNSGAKNIDIPHLVMGLLNLDESWATYFLRKYLGDGESQFMSDLIYNCEMEDRLASSLRASNENNAGGTQPGTANTKPTTANAPWRRLVTCMNDHYQSHNPLIGREQELQRTIQVLCRRDKNNPLHVGEPGVGKTALVWGLARLIAEGKVPPRLQQSRIYQLDLGTLVAGTQYRGDFENRIKMIMDGILEESSSNIVYIDEIHNLVGAGATGEGALDASNMLKPYLESGKIRFIGSTTYEEYNRYFARSKGLVRRFQQIDIPEPTPEEAKHILRQLREQYETFHDIVYDDEALDFAVDASYKHVNERFLPDKAIDLIDEAGASVEVNNKNTEKKSQKKSKVTKVEIADVLAKTCKVETLALNIDEDQSQLETLAPRLLSKIYGQDEAVKQVVEAVQMAKAGLLDEGKPLASLLFVGPTGVGKTEVARVLAKELGIELQRFDMSEYTEKHTVAKLIGSPAGYVGYEDGGLLTDAIRKTPNCVLLLDEIEKAHPDIYNILLQVMDYARLTDNKGRKADFRNVILLMTSNAGAQFAAQASVGFTGEVSRGEAMLRQVKKTFNPEFINRLSGTVVFNDMDRHMATLILRKKLSELQEKLTAKNVQMELADEAFDFLLQKGFTKEYGARELERVIAQQLKPILMREILFGSLKQGGAIKVKLSNGALTAEP